MKAYLIRITARLLMLIALAAAGPTLAQLPSPGRNAIQARLVAESDAPRPGSSVSVAFVMKPDPGWHGYWQNPGDAGGAAKVDWQLPNHVMAGPLRYPIPQTLLISGLMNYVFEGEYALMTELKIPASLPPGSRLPIKTRIDYLACTDRICVPEHASLSLDLVVGDGVIAPSRGERFDRYRAALPRPLLNQGRFERRGETIRMSIPIPEALALDRPYFFPSTDGALAYSAPQAISRKGDQLIVETRAAEGADPAVIEGVLRISARQGLSVVARPGAVPAAGQSISAETRPNASIRIVLTALLGAIVGGLLLNIMPCVFPILSLKALSLARAGGDERTVRAEALAYTAGVVLVCLALGAALLALRSGGAAVGWAFQLQDPRVILILLLLIAAIGLNLAGVFELPAMTAGQGLAQSRGLAGAFWTGALAAFVATPCTGPFMGAALGVALVLPAGASLAIFAGLGLGLALPFLLLGFLPPLRKRMPRPGPWMVRFRHVMAVPMFLTAAALAWVLYRQAGSGGLGLGMVAVIAVAAALWRVGARQGKTRAWLPLAPALAVGIAALVFIPANSAPAEANASTSLGAEPFSESRLAALRATKRPVFVYFTADWCVTCKVNEKAVLERAEVSRAFADRHVTILVGDWTRGDPAIGRFLEKHGRSGVPLYLYYAPGKDAQVLPQILTVATVEKAIA